MALAVDRQRLPVALPQLLQTLKQPAVDEDPVASGVEQMLGAGDGAGGAKERQEMASSATLPQAICVFLV